MLFSNQGRLVLLKMSKWRKEIEKEIFAQVLKWLKSSIEKNQDETKKMRKIIRMMNSGKFNYVIKIHIHSLWSNEGEPDIDFLGKNNSLYDAMRGAIKKFHQINDRLDFQAVVSSVVIVFDNGISLVLTEEVYKKYENCVLGHRKPKQ